MGDGELIIKLRFNYASVVPADVAGGAGDRSQSHLNSVGFASIVRTEAS